MSPLSLARCAGLMAEAVRDGLSLNQPMKGLNLSRTGALVDRQTDHMAGLSTLFSHEGQHPVWSPDFILETMHLSKVLQVYSIINKTFEL